MSRRTGLIDSAVEALGSRIASGEWPVGTRIPPEPALVELLVEAGASLSARDAQYQATPLEWAEHLGHLNIARIVRRRK